MHRFIIMSVLVGLGFGAMSAQAQTQEENKQFVNELREMALGTALVAPKKETSDGKSYERWLSLIIGEHKVGAGYVYHVTSGELMNCVLYHEKKDSGRRYSYFDENCDGVAYALAEIENHEPRRYHMRPAVYDLVLRRFRPLFEAVASFDKDIARPDLFALFDDQSIRDTRDVMDTMEYRFKSFPDSDGTEYNFGVAMRNHSFIFKAEKGLDGFGKSCLYIQSRPARERIWRDEDCDGGFESVSPDEGKMYKRNNGNGVQIAKQMRDLMEQTLLFMRAYNSLLKLPQ